MPDITEDIDSLNTIPDVYDDLRSKSKTVTFALQFSGTPYTLSKNSGFSMQEATMIYDNYHAKYTVSLQYTKQRIQEVTVNGFTDLAFGLRLRAPVLSKSILGKGSTAVIAEAEARTVGNAMAQSYGMLNNRAGIEFQERCLASPYAMDIRPIAHIHDAQYFIVRDNVEIVEWFNNNLIECMEWQKDPLIQHDVVKLGAELEIYYPTWAQKIKIPNNSSQDEIIDLCG